MPLLSHAPRISQPFSKAPRGQAKYPVCVERDGGEAGGAELLEDIQPEVRYGQSEGVEFAAGLGAGGVNAGVDTPGTLFFIAAILAATSARFCAISGSLDIYRDHDKRYSPARGDKPNTYS